MSARLGSLLLFLALIPHAAAQPNARGVTPAPPDFTSFRDEDKIAVLVGIDNYPVTSGLRELRYATKDASDLWTVLGKQGYKTALTEKDPVLLNADANKTAIKKTVKAALESLHGKGTFLFFFAGHGIEKNGKQYLAPREVDMDDLEGSALSMDDLLKILKDSPVERKVLFIDACREKDTRGDQELFGNVPDAKGTQIMYASEKDQPSHEDPDYQHGVFTYYLLKALAGEAAVRGLVSFNSVNTYLAGKLKSDKKALGQLPRVNSIETTENGDLLLAGEEIKIDLPSGFSNQQIMEAGKRYYTAEALKSATDYYGQKKYAEAAESLRVTLSLDPQNDSAYSLKTRIALRSSGAAVAADVCDQRLKIAQSGNDVLSDCADAFAESYPEQALQYIERIPPEKRVAATYLSLLDRANRLESIISMLQHMDFSAVYSRSTYTQFQTYINALRRTGEISKAETIVTAQIAVTEKARESEGTRGVVRAMGYTEILGALYPLRAALRERSGQRVPALIDYSEAMSMSSAPELRAQRCLLLAELGFEAEALVDCGKVQNKAGRLLAFGQAYYRLGKPQQAIEQFSAALQLSPSDKELFAKELFACRGYAYLLNGNLDKALPDFAKSIELDPKFPWPYRDRALTLSRAGKNDDALKDVNEALRLDPYFAEAYAARADIQRALGHSAEADKDGERAVQLGWKPNPKLP
jgi:tetratricopeptide (TPR) repeat protein